MPSSLMEKPNGFGISGRHKWLKNLVNLHEGKEALVLLWKLFPVFTLTQLGTNAHLQKSFKHTTNSLCLKAWSCSMCFFIFMLLCFVLFYFCVTEPGALPKPVRFGFLSRLDLTGDLSVYIAAALSDSSYLDSSWGVGVLWPLEQCEQSPRDITVPDCSK